MDAQKSLAAWRTFLAFAAGIIILAGIKAASGVITPIVIGVFIAFASAPLVFFIARKVPFVGAVVIVLLIEAGFLFGMGTLFLAAIGGLEQKIPIYSERFQLLSEQIAPWLRELGLDKGMLTEFDPQPLVGYLGNLLSNLGVIATNIVLSAIIVVFALFESRSIREKLESHLGTTRVGTPMLQEISKEITGYLGVKAIVSTITGVLSGFLCLAFNIDFPVLWGLVAFVLNFIPTIGSIIAAVPPVLIALVMQGSFEAVMLAGGYVTINVLLGNFIEPRLMGKTLGLSTLAIVLSLLISGWILGPVGALLSVPIVMLAKLIVEQIPGMEWASELLGPDLAERKSRVPPV